MIFFETLNSKDINYGSINYDRMPLMYDKIKDDINLPNIIHIIGTNGKGSTGRFIACMLKNAGFSVGHYTSPHIVDVHERFWIDGSFATDDILSNSHESLSKTLGTEEIGLLSYFEYLTFIAIFAMMKCDYIVLEAGLGGEHDATSVFPNILTIVTIIGMDHQNYLGKDIKSIATTKLKAIQKDAIVAKQIYDEVYDICEKLHISYTKVDEDIDIKLDRFPIFIQDNLKTAIVAIWKLGISADINGLEKNIMPGRCQRLLDNVIIDVGHNELAAKAIVEELSEDRYNLVFNMYKDKNPKKILEIFKKIVDKVFVIEIDSPRAYSVDDMISIASLQGYDVDIFDRVDKQKNWLVFGSFLSVESFLKKVEFERSI